MTPWVWFTIAGVAAVVGCALLFADYGRRTAHSRERRRWAALRGWRFVESDPVLPDRWHHGAIARGGAGQAQDLVSGRLFTSEERRAVHVFDLVQGSKVAGVVVAVQRRELPPNVVIELWLASVSAPLDAALDLLGPVGERYAFVSDVPATRPLLTPELVTASDEAGDDVPVVWAEQDWVLATAPAAATPARLERLLRALGDVADQLDASVLDEAVNGTVEPPRPRTGTDATDRSGSS